MLQRNLLASHSSLSLREEKNRLPSLRAIYEIRVPGGSFSVRKRLLTMVCMLFIGTQVALSQQDVQFTQYMFNTAYYNPGNTGKDGGIRLVAMHRSQWIGYQSSFGGGGAPSTQLLSATTSLEKIQSGFGLHLVHDNLGPQSNIEAQLSYAYHLNIGQSKLGFGMRAGIYSQTLNFDLYKAIDPDDPLLRPSGRQTQIGPDLTVGVSFHRKKYYAGVSFTHLVGTKFDFGVGQKNELVPHVYGTAGYFYDINLNLRLQLAGLVKSDFVTTTFDVSGLLYFKNILWGGISFRQSEAIILILGYSLLKDRSLSLGYALDYVIEAQRAKQPTSHEFMLAYKLPISLNDEKKVVRTPRYRH